MDILDFRPIFDTVATIVKSAVNPNTDTVIMIADIGPYESGPPLHYHPAQQETYEVLEGEGEFILGARTLRVTAGDIIEIPPETPHTFKNIGASRLVMRDTHLPALTFEDMMRELHGLVQSGRVRGFNNFTSLIYLSMLWVKHSRVQRSVTPPFVVMKTMNAIGKLFGYKI